MKVTRKIDDFGEKIGGARKDLARGIRIEDLNNMSNMDISKNITKAKIWGKIDYEELVNNGTPKLVAFYIKTLKDALPAKPPSLDKKAAENYIKFIEGVKEDLMNIKSEAEIETFFKDKVAGKYTTKNYYSYTPKPGYEELLTNKFFKAAQIGDLLRFTASMVSKKFLFTKDEKERADALEAYPIHKYKENTKWDVSSHGSSYFVVRDMFSSSYFYPKGELSEPTAWEPDTWFVQLNYKDFKNNFPTKEAAEEYAVQYYKEQQQKKKEEKKLTDTVPYLTSLRRELPKYHGIATVTTDAIQKTFNFRGGEFGNYESASDRVTNIERSYDALCALAETLNISVKDVPFNGRLAIAYGARGRGGKNAALAHYEPEKKVINLTKLKGAGSLAHEWMHALDHYLYNLELPQHEQSLTEDEVKNSKYLLSNNTYAGNIMNDLVNTMRFKEVKMSECNDPRYSKALTREKFHLQRAVRDFEFSMDSENFQKLENVIKDFQKNDIEYSDYRNIENNPDNLNPAIKKLVSDISELVGKDLSTGDRRIDSIIYNQASLTELKREESEEIVKIPTKFLSDARLLDRKFKSNKLYYSTNHEMLARAFACYVSDKLAEKGRVDDYLSGHSDIQSWTPAELGYEHRVKDGYISISPMGDERKTINKEFDKLFEIIKEKNVFKDFNPREISLYSEVHKKTSTQKNTEKKNSSKSPDCIEQMSIFDFDIEK